MSLYVSDVSARVSGESLSASAWLHNVFFFSSCSRNAFGEQPRTLLSHHLQSLTPPPITHLHAHKVAFTGVDTAEKANAVKGVIASVRFAHSMIQQHLTLLCNPPWHISCVTSALRASKPLCSPLSSSSPSRSSYYHRVSADCQIASDFAALCSALCGAPSSRGAPTPS